MAPVPVPVTEPLRRRSPVTVSAPSPVRPTAAEMSVRPVVARTSGTPMVTGWATVIAALPPTILTDPRSASLASRPEVTSKAPAPESVDAPTRTGRPEAEASVSSVEAPTKLAAAPASIVSAVRRTAEAPKATGPSKRSRSRTAMS